MSRVGSFEVPSLYSLAHYDANRTKHKTYFSCNFTCPSWRYWDLHLKCVSAIAQVSGGQLKCIVVYTFLLAKLFLKNRPVHITHQLHHKPYMLY